MTPDQVAIAGVLVAALGLFVHGRLRHDIVAFLALIACVILGLVPAEEAFEGFAHPATVTVALVLVTGRGLVSSGAVDRLAHVLRPSRGGPSAQVGSLAGVGSVLSAFMNNVGALALLMPVAIDAAHRARRSPAVVLMPLSFATILGGLVTLIGTPPNMIVAGYRHVNLGAPYRMFDFAWVGLPVAAAGVAFVALVGWRLIPASRRTREPHDLLAVDDYLAEARVPADSDWIDQPFPALAKVAGSHDVNVVGLLRGKKRYWASAASQDLRSGDVLLIEASPSSLSDFVREAALSLTGDAATAAERLRVADAAVLEVAVPTRSAVVGRTPLSLQLRRRHGVSLLAVSRQGRATRTRLRDFEFRAGDVLLLHGEREQVTDAVNSLELLALEERAIRLGRPREAWGALALFGAAIGVASLGWAALPVALGVTVVLYLLLGLLPSSDLYESIDWPVIVLLGAMMPVGGALQSTGATTALADFVVRHGTGLPVALLLGTVLVVTMTLSDVMNNAATTVVMAPIAAGLATRLDASVDAFLMAVAVGASCAFLTPIGHQNNTLILGPGGYRFGDYWRMGLPLEGLIVILAVPLILLVWGA